MNGILPDPNNVEDDLSLSAYIDQCIGTMNDTIQNAKSTTQGAGVTAVERIQETAVLSWNSTGSQMAAFGFKSDETPNGLIFWQASGNQIIEAINSVPLHLNDQSALDNLVSGVGDTMSTLGHNIANAMPSLGTLKWVGIGVGVLVLGVLVAYVVRAFK